MRVGPIVHGALLVAALGFAYTSWTRVPPKENKTGTHVVWKEDVAKFTSLVYDGDGKMVRIERRGSGADTYLWAQVDRAIVNSTKPKTPAPAPLDEPGGAAPAPADDGHGHGADDGHGHGAEGKKPADAKPADAKPAPTPGPAKATDAEPAAPAAPAAADAPAAPAGDAAAAPATPEEPQMRTKVFPVGEDGEAVVKNLSELYALRVLGVLTEERKAEYGLAESKENLTISFGERSHTLIVGARVFGGSDRYMLDPESGKGYVISAEIMKALDGGETTLGLKKVHAFPEDQLAALSIETPFGKKTLVKKVIEDDKGKQTGWADAAKPDAPDQALTNFVAQLDKLKPTDYEPDLDLSKLEKLATATYLDAKNGKLGYFELYKQAAPPGARGVQDEYYMVTERTRGPARANRMSAERISSNDLPQLFGQPGTAPSAPVPAEEGTPASLQAPATPPPPREKTMEEKAMDQIRNIPIAPKP